MRGLVCLLALLAVVGSSAGSPESRAQLLTDMLRLFPKSAPWEAWLQRTGELPPDFDALPSRADLPDPLRFETGRPVRNRREWTDRRKELLQLFADYVTGTVPPPPGNVRAIVREVHDEPDATVEQITLAFGPDERARLHLELILPRRPGPHPVFLTQDNHRRWALVAVSRGYVGAVYAGADSNDDTEAWTAIWPEHDWTKLTRRAWAASRCVDYLLTRPEIAAQRIALTGHSRNGKTSLIAAALDERISAVISSSSGAGGACSYRLFSEAQFGEGIELITRQFPDWLHPRLRFFAGREAKLPIDQHELIACIAPRPCLIYSAVNDNVESVWAIERTIDAALPVYRLLAAPAALGLRYRPGGHATGAQDIEGYVDWLDAQWRRASPQRGSTTLDRSGETKATTPTMSARIYPTYAEWQRLSGEQIDPRKFPAHPGDNLLRLSSGVAITNVEQWATKKQEIRRRVAWALGDPPPAGVSRPGDYGAEARPTATLLNRSAAPAGVVKESLNFGNYLAGDLYYPTNVDGSARKLPVFVWVHPVSVSGGYVPGYFRGEPPHAMLSRSGYAIFAFDLIGNGARVMEIQGFYRRYPHWSVLGKNVQDLRAAVDALQDHPHVDPRQIYLLGYASGAMAALHAAALDERVAGVIAVAGFTPMRSDTVAQGTGGVARWSHWLPFLPRLGAFVGHEERIPYDYHELLGLIAPRTALVITPGIDGQSTFGELRRCVTAAREAYAFLGNPAGLVFQRTDDYNHFSPDLIWCLCGVETIR